MIDPAKPRSYLLARYEIARIVGAVPAAIAISTDDHHTLTVECIEAGEMLPIRHLYGLPITVIPWWRFPDVILDDGRPLESWLMESWISDVGRGVRDVLHQHIPHWSDARGDFASEHAPPTAEDWSGPASRTLVGLWEKYVSIGDASDEHALRRLRKLGA